MEAARVSPAYKKSQLATIIPFIIPLAVFILMVVTTRLLISYPDDGIDGLDSAREIVSLDPEGPSINKLQEGDTIISYDDIPLMRTEINYSALKKKSGDDIEFLVLRDGDYAQVTITLAEPSRGLLASRLVAILVALVFWGIGLVIQAFKPSDKGSNIYSLWFYTSAATFTAGAASTMRLDWATVLFYSLVWILGPVSVQFHMLFPQVVRHKLKKAFLVTLYLIALIGIVPFLFFDPAQRMSFSWYPSYLALNRLFLSANLIIVVSLLVHSYRHAESPGVRGRIRLVLFGAVLAAFSFIILTILPEVLFEQPLIPYSFAFFLLGLLPLTYAYAIFRFHLIEFDQKINRGATLILVYSTLGAFYLVLYAVMNRWMPEEVGTTPLINTTLVLVLASIFIPLHRWVQRLVDRVFYGGWYDYRIGIRQITENLSQITELETLAQTVSASAGCHFTPGRSRCIFTRSERGFLGG